MVREVTRKRRGRGYGNRRRERETDRGDITESTRERDRRQWWN